MLLAGVCALPALHAAAAPEAESSQQELTQHSAAATPASPHDDSAPLLGEARTALGGNDHDAALRMLADVLARDPQNQEARQLRGDLYFKLGDLDKAMADFAELRTAKAGAWAARRAARETVDPLPVAELLRQADEEAHRRAHDRAIELYNQLLALDVAPGVASIALRNRGNVYREQKDRERALRDYDQAIRLNPANAGAYINRGSILAERGDHDSAVKDYDEAIRFRPKFAEAYYNRALSLREAERGDAALRDFETAIRLKRDFALAHAALGLLLAEQGQRKRAKAALETAGRLNPALAQVWIGLAQLDESAGKMIAAAAKLEKAIAAAPDSAMSRNSVAWLYATSTAPAARNGRKAVEHARRACELTNWSEYGYIDTLAAAYAEQGDFTRATDFQWYALSLWDPEDDRRAEGEQRLALYQKRQRYREAARRENNLRPQPTPKPRQFSPAPAGPVGMSSPRLPRSGGPAGFARAPLQSSVSALQSCCR